MNHCLTEVNEMDRTAVCSVCGPTRFKDKGGGKGRACIARLRERQARYAKSPKGKLSQKLAQKRMWQKRGTVKNPWRKFVKPVCERCGYKAVDMVLMDGHHKDHNRKNNVESNIESLCAFCHRLIHRDLEHLIQPAYSANPIPAKAPVPSKQGNDGGSEVEELKSLQKRLLDNIQELEDQKAAVEHKLSEVMDNIVSDQAGFWKDRCLRAETKLKSLEG